MDKRQPDMETDAPAFVLRLREHGMFSNVNEVIQHAYLANLGGYKFAIDWAKSCYRDPSRQTDPWTYYFEPCFADLPGTGVGLPALSTGPEITCARDNIITPRLVDGQRNPLLLPVDRLLAGTVVDRAIRLNRATRAIVSDFRSRTLQGPFIGLHIRGPGRTDGGAKALRAMAEPGSAIPLDLYFEAADRALKAVPGARVFCCSDSSAVISAARARYGERLVTYEATRSDYGEMHRAQLPQNAGQSFSPFKLGLDVVVEAHVLAASDFLVHGNSNVANFVLCRSPDLSHDYVYGDLAHEFEPNRLRHRPGG